MERVKKLSKEDIKKITGGWGPAKIPNSRYAFDDLDIIISLQGLKWRFSEEEVEELKRHGYRLMEDRFGFTLLDENGSRIFYEDKANQEMIEEILGKKSSHCECC